MGYGQDRFMGTTDDWNRERAAQRERELVRPPRPVAPKGLEIHRIHDDGRGWLTVSLVDHAAGTVEELFDGHADADIAEYAAWLEALGVPVTYTEEDFVPVAGQ